MSGWPTEGGEGDDVYRDTWENYNYDWDFGALNEQEEDWPDFGEPALTGQSLHDTLLVDHPSSTFEGSSPPRPSRDNPRPPFTHSPARDNFTSTSQRSMGNTSSSTNLPDTQTQQRLQPRHTVPTSSTNRRRPPAHYSEDWLDRTAIGGASSFGYLPNHFFEPLDGDSAAQHSEESDGVDIDDVLSEAEEEEEEEAGADMPPTTRRRRTRGSIVDLTNDASSPAASNVASTPQPRNLKRAAEPSQTRPSKRRHPSNSEPEAKVEELDLTNEAPSAEEELLQAQQEQAIRAQQQADAEAANGPIKIGKRQCIICMENFTNATITACGHIYCHECLTQALIAGEKNSERGVGNCPVCRKPVSRKKANQMIPISFMKKSTFKGKARRDAGLLA